MPDSSDGGVSVLGTAGRIHVDRTLFGVSESDSQSLDVQKFQTNPAYVRVQLGATLNLGDYESARIDVSISVPCYTEEIGVVYGNVRQRVEDLIAVEVEAVKSKIASLRKPSRPE